MIELVRSSKSSQRSVVFLSEQYASFTASDQILKDVECFCVHGSGTLVVDTTFELYEGLWLTDSSFEYQALLSENGKHPSFPGPFMWCFKKDRSSYRYDFSFYSLDLMIIIKLTLIIRHVRLNISFVSCQQVL